MTAAGVKSAPVSQDSAKNQLNEDESSDAVAAVKTTVQGFKGIDMRSKGLLWQVHTQSQLARKTGGTVTRQDYDDWVHTPFYFKEEPKHMRFFENDILEYFSKVHPLQCSLDCVGVVSLPPHP